ncbi:M14 family metallopeptidase [Casimicrobium huifangae]|uniref:M14 family metallopeptidase n=1 Tax=Casimicrobium huifangae TaxID=2591109 RepID=UPI0012EB993F|nr:M14 family metallopeptidase [Casimicrobium huifangae]
MFPYDRFVKFEELTTLLRSAVDAHPGLARMASIGSSHEGRSIWCVTLTNYATGEPLSKPAFYVDANIHATELSGSVAALKLIDTVLSGYGKRADLTRLLDSRTLYVIPRVNPDGAEWAMADKPKYIRSSTRPYPYAEDAIEGLEPEDIDGDGRILMMRFRDDNGPWKKHASEPRLMVRRDPVETGGEYYRIVSEGRIKAYDGFNLPVARVKTGLDLNRNFPEEWRPESEQLGAGDFPTSEPEVRACVEFVNKHRNICGGVFFHTWSGVLLRPFGTKADDEMAPEDLWVFQTQGKKGEELTGYPAISVFHEFKYHPKEVITGTQDWLYTELGSYAWVVEIWCPMREAGIKDYKFIDWFRDHPVDDDLKLLKWTDETHKGKGYVDWYPYDHPELGKVELGGWNRFHTFSNPPPHLMEKEVQKFPDWIVFQALMSPKLEHHSTRVTSLGGDLWRIDFGVHNTGYLPTDVSKLTRKKKYVRGVVAEITLPDGAALVEGKARIESGQLEGRNNHHTLVSFWPGANATEDRLRFSWIVRAPAGAAVTVEARHDRAGTVTQRISLN